MTKGRKKKLRRLINATIFHIDSNKHVVSSRCTPNSEHPYIFAYLTSYPRFVWLRLAVRRISRFNLPFTLPPYRNKTALNMLYLFWPDLFNGAYFFCPSVSGEYIRNGDATVHRRVYDVSLVYATFLLTHFNVSW